MQEVLSVLTEEDRLGLAPAAAAGARAPAAGPSLDSAERMIEEMKRRRASMEAPNA